MWLSAGINDTQNRLQIFGLSSITTVNSSRKCPELHKDRQAVQLLNQTMVFEMLPFYDNRDRGARERP